MIIKIKKKDGNIVIYRTNKPIYGFHCRIDMGIDTILDCALQTGKCFQIYLEGRMGSGNPNRYPSNVKEFCQTNGVKMFVHGPLNINLARDYRLAENKWMYQKYLSNLKLSNQLGAIGNVVHTGKTNLCEYGTKKKCSISKEEGIKNMKDGLEYIVEQMREFQTLILVETPAGQGSELLCTVEELVDFYKSLSPKCQEHVGFCVDTCHIFAAGYDISNSFKEYVEKFGNCWSKVKLIHLNDSEYPCHSRKDRHRPVGCGRIGNGLKEVVKAATNYQIPMVVETYDDVISTQEFIKN